MSPHLHKIFVYKNNAPQNDIVINLCEKAIKSAISNDYELCVLDKNNVANYIDFELLNFDSNKINLSTFNKDYLFLCILYCNGGIIIEPDVILTKDFSEIFNLLEPCDLVVFGESFSKISKSFFMANKKALVLKELINNYVLNTKNTYNICLEVEINKLNNPKIVILDSEKTGYEIEKTIFGVSGDYIYKNCYFTSGVTVDEFFESTRGITKLKYPLTPTKYKNMKINEFLKQDILIAKIFNKLLS